MALVFDNRHNLQPGEPGIHALIAGVSFYKHLPGGDGPPAENDWGLPQLSATALTGYKMYRWLIDRRKQLPKKLATIRLLLSPSAAEASKIAEGMAEIKQALTGEGVTLIDTPSRCTLENFVGEARRWRKDAISEIDDSNVTFFYFAGHGIQRKNNDPVLLVEDFGNPDAGMVARTVEFNALFEGMAPLRDPLKKMARTQLYFVDACRVRPDDLTKYKFPSIADIFDVELGGEDKRSAPVFYATVSNTKAYAKSGQQTLFSEALIACLDGLAGTPTNEEDAEGYARYSVSIYSLAEALNAKAESIRSLGVDQEIYPTSNGRDEVIVKLEKPPEVECTLHVEPEPAARLVSVNLQDSVGTLVPGWSLAPVDPNPYRGPLRAGFYHLEAKITNPPQPPYVDLRKQIVNISPLKGFQLKARMIS
jgi:hypothetical protein